MLLLLVYECCGCCIGYNNYAEYATADTMAGKPEKVLELIEQVWGPAKRSVARERLELEEYIKNTSDRYEISLYIVFILYRLR